MQVALAPVRLARLETGRMELRSRVVRVVDEGIWSARPVDFATVPTPQIHRAADVVRGASLATVGLH